MRDIQELIDHAHEFVEAVSATAGLVPAAALAATVYGAHHARKKTMTPDKAKKFVKKNPIAAELLIPKNKRHMHRLANRGVASHIGHGLMRGMVPFGTSNIVRYGYKVDAAKRGLHRE